jgi:low affinity Fe/Cu permease
MKAQFPPIEDFNDTWKMEFSHFSRYRMLVIMCSLTILTVLATMV